MSYKDDNGLQQVLNSYIEGRCKLHYLPSVVFIFVHLASQLSSKAKHSSSYGILARPYQFKVLAMNHDIPTVAALILVPIAIAASAAFIALKASHFSKTFARALNRKFPRTTSQRRRRKLRRSNLTSSQTYADSWVDLESNAGDEPLRDTFINQSPIRRYQYTSSETACGIDTSGWHPNRNDRLTWSFVNPTSPIHHRSESSSVARPLPVVQRPDRLSEEDVDSLSLQTRVEEVRQRPSIDL
jgi:hypothetical protein